MLFGRTQLIKLSPKKTVEGFVGAAFTTVVFAYIVSRLPAIKRWEIKTNFCSATVGYHLHAIQLHDLPSYRSRNDSLLKRPMPAERRLQLALLCPSKRSQPHHKHGLPSRTNTVGTLPVPRYRNGHLRVTCSSIWRILCFRLQACFQCQGLRRLHSGPWWNDRSYGLPVSHLRATITLM